MADSKLLKEQESILKQYECPFTWEMPKNNETYIDTFLTILSERCENIEEEHEFNWTSFNIHLVLSFEFWKQKGDLVNAIQHVNTCLNELQRLTAGGCTEQLFLTINGTLWHVALATKANLHHINKESALTSELISNIKPKIKLTKSEKAGFLGIRAAVYRQYKPFGFDMALKMAVNASHIDPQQAEWHFITANVLGRIRRLKKGVITHEELEEMRKAFTLQKDATYTVHMAQMFTDFACYIYHNRYNKSICSSVSEAGNISKTYSKSAVRLYRKALAFRPYCPGLKLRMAHGLIRIPDLLVVDYQWAKKLLDEASVHLPESAMLYHDLGRYYDRFQIPEQAVRNLRRAHELYNYPAFTYLVVLWWKYDCHWDLVSEIEAALEQYVTDDNQAELNVLLGTSHLLLNDDWETAVECYVKSVSLDPQAKYMKKFCGFYWREKTNLLDIITNEIRIKIKNNESVRIFNTLLEKVYLSNPHLERVPLVPEMYEEFKKSQLAHRIRTQEESSEETESEY